MVSGLAPGLALEGIPTGVPLIHPILGLNDVFGLVPDLEFFRRIQRYAVSVFLFNRLSTLLV